MYWVTKSTNKDKSKKTIAIGLGSILGSLFAKFAITNQADLHGKVADVFDVFEIDVAHAAPSSNGTAGSTSGPTASAPTQWSTPFLFTWNGKEYEMENDFLFGKPASAFFDLEEGRKSYESGLVGSDLYKIQNVMKSKNGKLVAQIKEIEPEETFFDHFSLTRVVYPKDGELIVNGMYDGFSIFDKKTLKKKNGMEAQKVTFQGKDETSRFGNPSKLWNDSKGLKENVMETGSVIEIKGKVVSKNIKPTLLIRSRNRDVTLGHIIDLTKLLYREEISSNEYLGVRPINILRVSGLVLMVGGMWLSGFASNLFKGPITEYTNKNVGSIGLQTIHADVPTGGSTGTTGGGKGNSFIIEYWNWSTKCFQKILVTEPRHYQYSTDAVSVPLEAISKSKEVRIRVIAAKRHNLSFIGLIASKKLSKSKQERITVKKAFHQRLKKDYANLLQEKNSKSYLHIIPGDVVDMEFDVGKIKLTDSEQESYLLQAGGFYGPASQESQILAGDWVSKLDPEIKEWLKGVYSLEEYHKPDRTPVLS